MAASNEWFEYHLTKKGWVSGSAKLDSGLEEVKPPKNRILTRRYSEYLAATYAPFKTWCNDMWEIDDKEKVNKYLKKYPYPSKRFKSYEFKK